MELQDYKASFTVAATPEEVFDSINNIALWWTDDLEGDSHQVNDEFTVTFGDIHVSTQQVVELVPAKKIAWLVTNSKLAFVESQEEWTGTRICFELSAANPGTRIDFTHVGLVPGFQCYKGCAQGWDHYFKGSLFKLLTEGKGTPGL